MKSNEGGGGSDGGVMKWQVEIYVKANGFLVPDVSASGVYVVPIVELCMLMRIADDDDGSDDDGV